MGKLFLFININNVDITTNINISIVWVKIQLIQFTKKLWCQAQHKLSLYSLGVAS